MKILDVVLPVFLVIGLGAFLRSRGLLSEETRTALTRFVFYVAAPCLLFGSTARTPARESLNPTVLGAVIAVTVVTAVAAYLVAYRASPARRGVFAQGTHRSNMVFMGVPILTYAYGEQTLGSVAVLIGIMVVVYNFLAVIVLSLPHSGERRLGAVRAWGLTAGQIGRNPLIIGCAGGLALAVTGIPLPVTLERSLGLVGRTALPLALLSVGGDLDFRRLRGDIGVTAVVAAAKLVVYPALVALVLRAAGLAGPSLAAPVLLMASPTAVVSYIMSRELQGDHRLAGAIIIGTTTASLFTYAGWLLVLGRL
jgi:predicted permease